MVCIHGHTRTTWWNLLIVIGKELFKRKAESKNEVRLFAKQQKLIIELVEIAKKNLPAFTKRRVSNNQLDFIHIQNRCWLGITWS